MFQVCHIVKGIKTNEFDVRKANIVASATMRDNFAATVELYSIFIK
jgi:hypothetical protein